MKKNSTSICCIFFASSYALSRDCAGENYFGFFNINDKGQFEFIILAKSVRIPDVRSLAVVENNVGVICKYSNFLFEIDNNHWSVSIGML